MKFIVHVPTEQFGFVSCEWEGDDKRPRDAVQGSREMYSAIAEAFKPQPVNSLPEKEFNAILDEYLSKKSITNGQEQYVRMSPKQQDIIQAIKRSFARLKK